jgi:hypothetical protein
MKTIRPSRTPLRQRMGSRQLLVIEHSGQRGLMADLAAKLALLQPTFKG